MIEANFQKSLQAFARRRPFKPFVVELTSGDRFVVDHPEALAQRGAVAVFIDRKGYYSLFDGSTVSQLAELGPSESKAQRRRNGRE